VKFVKHGYNGVIIASNVINNQGDGVKPYGVVCPKIRPSLEMTFLTPSVTLSAITEGLRDVDPDHFTG